MKFRVGLRLGWLLGSLCCPLAAMAYRPFEGTDAAVVAKRESEIELGVDFANHRGQNALIAPSLRYNYGFAENWETSLEADLQVFDSGGGRHLQILDPELNLKVVLLDGPLQERGGPLSLAFEFGALPPETVASSWGVEAVMIASWRTGEFTWHLNTGLGWERELREPSVLWGLIVERKISDTLRLAVEVNGESARHTGPDNSILLGVLWEHGKVTYDAGVRFGFSAAAPDVAFTLGLTSKL